ncbi:MAG: hypothetical protein UT55_C0021G0006 [Candidatus Peregrinibacteria bacterium GW2011_GWE2_39_6]|nr:MAG: hypothetical protein UT55_C0021G0006 [Candidatus Peregrinibacteria bacterium GW2011_GWE2_39_6]HCW31892.1 hypothetical protein [Candidatus Peregrinibacteria bacterium]
MVDKIDIFVKIITTINNFKMSEYPTDTEVPAMYLFPKLLPGFRLIDEPTTNLATLKPRLQNGCTPNGSTTALLVKKTKNGKLIYQLLEGPLTRDMEYISSLRESELTDPDSFPGDSCSIFLPSVKIDPNKRERIFTYSGKKIESDQLATTPPVAVDEEARRRDFERTVLATLDAFQSILDREFHLSPSQNSGSCDQLRKLRNIVFHGGDEVTATRKEQQKMLKKFLTF